jgi:hypothetical protein
LISVVSNCSLLALELGRQQEAGLEASWLLGWVGLEHLLLVLFLAIDQLISDLPAHVKLAMDKTDYFFKHQAVKVKQD